MIILKAKSTNLIIVNVLNEYSEDYYEEFISFPKLIYPLNLFFYLGHFFHRLHWLQKWKKWPMSRSRWKIWPSTLYLILTKLFEYFCVIFMKSISTLSGSNLVYMRMAITATIRYCLLSNIYTGAVSIASSRQSLFLLVFLGASCWPSHLWYAEN